MGVLRVMTWNVWWRFGPMWVARHEVIGQTLRAVAPDVVALQEVWGTRATNQVVALGAELGLHGAYAGPSYPPATDVARDPRDAGVEMGIGLLSRWEITGWRVVQMPARHRAFDPVAVVATIAHPVASLHVVVGCLEYDPAYNDDRLAQAALLASLATDPALDGPLPVVVAGDLNAPPDSPLLRPLSDVLTDAWVAGDGDPAVVTAPAEAGPELLGQRIDHVYFRPGMFNRPVTVTEASTAGDSVNGITPSDHRAVVCSLGF
ncbi:endonuclease/exonuclease/phosphatase family metal-dependent hydrolase [Kribbella steppae]|uniref:Endonuclease/exonuclease/phosphatase family metal-dependent hydrolase n=1 Tax=Kribbella steppae TaxID=2512223 RepID=A0A4R2HG34_9ACTN|nr:endonuclease/exonuclease/phosphatase family protein [Kribbella steppae]TCO26476.1 endonuclease/exonuclease/phosphatase family metal-dependent hydrolase [Kribbella steppae]